MGWTPWEWRVLVAEWAFSLDNRVPSRSWGQVQKQLSSYMLVPACLGSSP